MALVHHRQRTRLTRKKRQKTVDGQKRLSTIPPSEPDQDQFLEVPGQQKPPSPPPGRDSILIPDTRSTHTADGRPIPHLGDDLRSIHQQSLRGEGSIPIARDHAYPLDMVTGNNSLAQHLIRDGVRGAVDYARSEDGRSIAKQMLCEGPKSVAHEMVKDTAKGIANDYIRNDGRQLDRIQDQFEDMVGDEFREHAEKLAFLGISCTCISCRI